MNPKLQSYLSILQNTALLLANPALGIGANAGRIVLMLNYASAVFTDVLKTADDLKVVDDQIKEIVARGTPPTEDEWAPWDARLAAVDAGFAALKASLPPKT